MHQQPELIMTDNVTDRMRIEEKLRVNLELYFFRFVIKIINAILRRIDIVRCHPAFHNLIKNQELEEFLI